MSLSNVAKIVVSGEAVIPTHFELAFDLAGTRRTCELVWWHGKTAGVKFVRYKAANGVSTYGRISTGIGSP